MVALIAMYFCCRAVEAFQSRMDWNNYFSYAWFTKITQPAFLLPLFDVYIAVTSRGRAPLF